MGSFPDRLQIELLPQEEDLRKWWQRLCFWRQRRRKWKLLSRFRYVDSRGETHEVPVAAVVNGASNPTFLYRLIGPPWGEYAEASVIHDWLWGLAMRGIISFAKANWVFLDAMITSRVARWRRRAMWLGVSAKSMVMRKPT